MMVSYRFLGEEPPIPAIHRTVTVDRVPEKGELVGFINHSTGEPDGVGYYHVSSVRTLEHYGYAQGQSFILYLQRDEASAVEDYYGTH